MLHRHALPASQLALHRAYWPPYNPPAGFLLQNIIRSLFALLQHFLRQLRDLPLVAESALPITQQVRNTRGALHLCRNSSARSCLQMPRSCNLRASHQHIASPARFPQDNAAVQAALGRVIRDHDRLPEMVRGVCI